MNKKILCGILSISFLLILASTSFAADVSFENIFGIETARDFLLSMIDHLRAAIVVLAILFIVLGGIFYITAGEHSERITTAKNIWVGSIIGLLIALLGPTFLKEIQNDFLKDGNLPTDINEVLTLKEVLTNVLITLLSIIGILTILSLVVSGFTLIFSFGDSSRAEKAKEMIKWSIIGLALAGASVIIVKQIALLIMPA